MRAMMKHYIAFLDQEPGYAVGVRVPDLPGCFSAGDDLDDAIKNATEAIEILLEVAIEQGEKPPKARTLEELRKDPETAGMFEEFIVAAVPYSLPLPALAAE
jgi:predicted RNase H-like HicB family nuclease